MSRGILPPLKKEWREGQHQIGLFIRDNQGRVVQVSWNNVDQLGREVAYDLLHILATGKQKKSTP